LLAEPSQVRLPELVQATEGKDTLTFKTVRWLVSLITSRFLNLKKLNN
jgi:hypothetical protein